MGLLIFLFFVFFPIAEVMVLGRVMSRIGFWDTFALIILSGVLGFYLAKLQGKATLVRVQQALAEGRMPTSEMLDGLMIFLGGVLFLIPGFLSDVLGISLLFPLTRWIGKWILLKNIKVFSDARGTQKRPFGKPKSDKSFPGARGDVEDAQIIE